MARKNVNPKALVDGALASLRKTLADLDAAVKAYDADAKSKRATATSLNAQAALSEQSADDADVVAAKIRALITA
jgi:hypothetical protein